MPEPLAISKKEKILASSWISYNDLAWTENLLANPEEYKNEVLYYVDLIKRYSSISPSSLLHLGCGAGGQDTFFKQYFKVTGVDLSDGMLRIARNRHPEIDYIEGDMKNIHLNQQFDAVVIPDSIDYMVTGDELNQAFTTAALHLKIGGVLLIVAKTEDSFKNNNFAYNGENKDVSVTLLENNYINPYKPNTYEATFLYLIRKCGELSIYTEHQLLGLF
jgi:ubiquinone/menaquinone biosynthesis C-methylase UbiE